MMNSTEFFYPIDYFWRAAERWPDRIAIDAPGKTWRYDRLAAEVCAFAAALRAQDPQPQSRVGICCPNSAEHVVALLAVLACGKIWVPLNPKSTRPEIRRIVDATEPSIVIGDVDCAPLLEGLPGHRIWSSEQSLFDSKWTIAELIRQHAGASRPRLALDLEATQAIKFTGGTTGAPKGVMQPYRAWMACIANLIEAWELGPDDRYVAAAPMTHGTSTFLLPVLAQGGCHVMLSGAGAAAVHAGFRDCGGTIAFMPPTLIYMLMALPGASRKDFPCLRRLIYAGSPMPAEKIRQALAFFGPVIGTTYGQTEAPQIVTYMRPEDFQDPHNWSAVGRAGRLTDIGVMAPDGRLLSSGEIGEVVVRGDLVMSGYWRLPELTATAIVDGWLHTGDRGLLDRRGYLYLKDRLKEMVITGGFNVYPSDVENALGQHPAVHECAVFGLPDDKWGETVNAAVQLRPGERPTESELMMFVRERLGPVHTPKRIHFRSSLPRSVVGKVLKGEIREELMRETFVEPGDNGREPERSE